MRPEWTYRPDPKNGRGFASWRYLTGDAVEAALFARAVLATCLELRELTASPWCSIPSLRCAIARVQNIRLSTLYDTTAALGLYLDNREDWLTFANRVAERLPLKDTEPCDTQR